MFHKFLLTPHHDVTVAPYSQLPGDGLHSLHDSTPCWYSPLYDTLANLSFANNAWRTPGGCAAPTGQSRPGLTGAECHLYLYSEQPSSPESRELSVSNHGWQAPPPLRQGLVTCCEGSSQVINEVINWSESHLVSQSGNQLVSQSDSQFN